MKGKKVSKVHKVIGDGWVGILSEEDIFGTRIITLEWVPRLDLNVVTGTSVEGVMDQVDMAMEEMDYDLQYGDYLEDYPYNSTSL